MTILDAIRKRLLTKAPEFAEARTAVAAESESVRAAIEAAERRCDDLVLDGTDEERAAAEAELAALERLYRDLDVARVKLGERHAEAVKKEQRGEVEVAAKAVAAKIAARGEQLRSAIKAVRQLAAAKAGYDEADAAWRAHNQRAASLGFNDLAVSSGWDEMMAELGGATADSTREGIRQILGVADKAAAALVYCDVLDGQGKHAK